MPTRKLLHIEKRLQKASTESAPLYSRYEVIRANLAPIYSFWAGGFPSGNDHGWPHIERVLAHLDEIVDVAPKGVSDFEVFLAALAVLFHDWAMVRGRENHPRMGAQLAKLHATREELSAIERDIVTSAIASHGGKTKIEVETAGLPQTVLIHNHTVRPGVVAALVRLADELDEDERRAPERAELVNNTPHDSLFYWHFCQNITGIRARKQAIEIQIRFRPEDLERQFEVSGRPRAFPAAVAEKIAKLNTERGTTNKYLRPAGLAFDKLVLTTTLAPRVSAPYGDESAVPAREFVFLDATTASEYLHSIGELWWPLYNELLIHALELAQDGKYEQARDQLGRLENVIDDLPSSLAVSVLYDQACFASRQASAATGEQEEAYVAEALDYLKRWHARGLAGAWRQSAKTEHNELHRMVRDEDLAYVVSRKEKRLLQALPRVKTVLPTQGSSGGRGGGGGGCIAYGEVIQTAAAVIRIEQLREGDHVLTYDRCVNETGGMHVGSSRVDTIVTHRGIYGIRLNDSVTISPTQPLLRADGRWILAADVTEAVQLLSTTGDSFVVSSIARVPGPISFFDVSVVDEPHTFAAGPVICHNKYPWSWRDELP